jgi:ribonuclease HI
VATPLNKSVKYTTRNTSQGVIYSFLEPEKVYRRRLNRLAPRRLLESLGEEALTDIQYLFQTNNNQSTVNTPTNNPNVVMSAFLRPLKFTAIQGAPHAIPDKAIEKLPCFQGNNAISAHSHVLNFDLCVLKYCRGHDEEDVKMTLFVYSLEGDAAEWFSEFDPNKFSTLDEIVSEFKERWGDQKENRFLLASLTSSHKKENETMEEFNKKFNDLVKSLPNTIMPSNAAILIYYMEAFEGEMRYALRDKDPQNLKQAQTLAVRIDKNMQDARKSNIPGFTRGSSSKSSEEKKKKVEGQESSSDGIKELTQLIKQMEINHANQINALQNRLITMERSQNNRPHHKPNDKWPKRTSPHDQRPPNPFESTNLVDHQAIPYCRPCDEFHEEITCPVFLEGCYDDDYGNQGNEQVNMCGRKYNVGMYNWMEFVEQGSSASYMNNVVDKAMEKFGPKPTPQQVSKMAEYRGITYQRNGNRNHDKSQANIPKVAPTPPKSSVHINSDLNIDLGGWLSNAKMSVPVSEIMKIPSQREKLLKAIEDPPWSIFYRQQAIAYQDAPVILQNWDRRNEKNQPFFLSLLVNNKVLYNCMLDSGASSNVMTKKVMEQLNLRISRPYHNICAMDSKMIKLHGLIKILQVHLTVFPDIMFEMDIVVIDVPDVWGMLLSRKAVANLGGNLQMDLTYAIIPTPDGNTFKLNRELERRYHVEDPKNPKNEFKYREDDLGSYAILSNSIVPFEEEIKDDRVDKAWYMNFDGAFSRSRKGVGIVIQAPNGQEFKFSYRLEFDATNNVAEYEALLLGLEVCKDMGVKCLNIKRDLDLVIQQLKNKFACKLEKLKKYRNAIWDSIGDLDALNLIAIPREQNYKDDELAVVASTLQLSNDLIKENIYVEVIFKPSVLDNMDHWKFFDDDNS